MRTEPRCSECESEDPKIVSLRDPAAARFCGRLCFYKGQQKLIRWLPPVDTEAVS
ncbi:hypothetical protein IC762_02770 [Bradyrhizobium genosp. L]|uniref:hypothetical protein n=1 Tax=Bradyrhizobium genosp. L TaxID=83637 RepID=UPI0018A26C77|nr:hypothetical protein [Bradyrhizobium genosp. L]QPF85275.1 hypothetical protein IC762_02770 [Bradyrhizobium genosp. L]